MAEGRNDDSDSVPATPDELIDSYPASPGSIDESSEASTPLDPPSSSSDAAPSHTAGLPGLGDLPRRVPSLRTVSDPQALSPMSASSSVTGTLTNARRPPPSANSLPVDIMARARALQQQRMGMAAARPALSTHSTGSSGDSPLGASSPLGTPSMSMGGLSLTGGMPQNMRLPGGLPGGLGRPMPMPHGFPQSAPVIPTTMKKASLSERRQMKLGGFPGPGGAGSPAAPPKLSDMRGASDNSQSSINGEGRGSKLSDFKNYIDAEKGWITFEGAATISRTGVDFAGGQKFSISLDEIDIMDELGKGNYGTVYKVRHARPRKPRFGPGLSGFKSSFSRHSSGFSDKSDESGDGSPLSPASSRSSDATSGVVMAMKEIRLELDESKFTTILKELVILHECVSPYIIDFYGAFFQEGAVYMCIEYMDGGSIDKLYTGGIPESVLRKITYSTIMGLKSLKDEHNIIHRDVKPTNILVNSRGQVKICDFGVSGNLVASIAKTNIGCQSYMAPERISGGGMSAAGSADGSYSVQSDIWSLGLTIIECAMGRYPYPPEVSSTIFSQLSAIVEGDPPDLPPEGYSDQARDFVKSCLNKNPKKRHTYPMLLTHPWMKALGATDVGATETIAEDAEAEEAAEAGAVEALELADATRRLKLGSATATLDGSGDAEVAAWVVGVLEAKQRGKLPKVDETAGGPRPALHAAPLDSISPADSPLVA